MKYSLMLAFLMTACAHHPKSVARQGQNIEVWGMQEGECILWRWDEYAPFLVISKAEVRLADIDGSKIQASFTVAEWKLGRWKPVCPQGPKIQIGNGGAMLLTNEYRVIYRPYQGNPALYETEGFKPDRYKYRTDASVQYIE